MTIESTDTVTHISQEETTENTDTESNSSHGPK